MKGQITVYYDLPKLAIYFQEPTTFSIIDPQELLAPLQENKGYEKLLKYLSSRYWSEK